MLETRDLLLKKAAFEDWPDIYANLWRHAESARYMLWNVTESEEEARDRMRRTLAYEEKHEFALLVYEKQSGKASTENRFIRPPAASYRRGKPLLPA